MRPALDRLEVLAEHDDELVLAGTDLVVRPISPAASPAAREAGAPPARTLALAWRPRSPRAAAFRALAPTIAAGMTA